MLNHIYLNSWKLSMPLQNYHFGKDAQRMAIWPFLREWHFTFQGVRHPPTSPFLYALPSMIYYHPTSSKPPSRKRDAYSSGNGKRRVKVRWYSAPYPFTCIHQSIHRDSCYWRMIRLLSYSHGIKDKALRILSNSPFCSSILPLL